MFLEAVKDEFKSPAVFGLWLVLAIVVALAGPFGSYGILSFAERLQIWIPIVGVGIATGLVVRAYVLSVLKLRDFLRGSVLISVIITLLLTPPLYLLVNNLFSDRMPSLPGLWEIVTIVFAVSLGAGALRVSREALEARHKPADDVAVPPAAKPKILGRLDPSLHGNLSSITVRDHYVDVRTDKGLASILLRFSDAVDEAAPVDGAQVHRSHWVAWAEVAAVERDGQKISLAMKSGERIPVSKNHRDKLAGRGLI